MRLQIRLLAAAGDDEPRRALLAPWLRELDRIVAEIEDRYVLTLYESLRQSKRHEDWRGRAAEQLGQSIVASAVASTKSTVINSRDALVPAILQY